MTTSVASGSLQQVKWELTSRIRDESNIPNAFHFLPAITEMPSRIGASIRALSDLCFEIISGRLEGQVPPFPLGLLLQLLKAPARPGLSLTLCASAGTEPGGKVRRWSVGHDLPPRGVVASPGPSPHTGGRNAYAIIPQRSCRPL
jgi:hypothetical protein